MTTQESCTAAADLLEKDGWCIGTLYTTCGKHCILGALLEVNRSFDYQKLTNHVRDVGQIESLATWNDRQVTVKSILVLLRKAAMVSPTSP